MSRWGVVGWIGLLLFTLAPLGATLVSAAAARRTCAEQPTWSVVPLLYSCGAPSAVQLAFGWTVVVLCVAGGITAVTCAAVTVRSAIRRGAWIRSFSLPISTAGMLIVVVLTATGVLFPLLTSPNTRVLVGSALGLLVTGVAAGVVAVADLALRLPRDASR